MDEYFYTHIKYVTYQIQSVYIVGYYIDDVAISDPANSSLTQPKQLGK